MTRFALIPLAILANACASADEVQDGMSSADYDVVRDIEQMNADGDRSTDDHRQRVYDYTEAVFGQEVRAQGCDVVGAVIGGWPDRSFTLKADMISPSGKVITSMEGKMRYIDNSTGVFGAKGFDAKHRTGVVMEGDWFRDHLEADMYFGGPNTDRFRVIGLKRHDGLGGHVIGVVADCT